MTEEGKVATTKIPTLEELLSRRGIIPDAKFSDYQGYIEKQDRLGNIKKTESCYPVPSRNIHIGLNRLIDPSKS